MVTIKQQKTQNIGKKRRKGKNNGWKYKVTKKTSIYEPTEVKENTYKISIKETLMVTLIHVV